MTKVLAVASMGGHREQLQIVAEAFKNKDAVFMTTTQDQLKQAIRHGFVFKNFDRNCFADELTSI